MIEAGTFWQAAGQKMLALGTMHDDSKRFAFWAYEDERRVYYYESEVKPWREPLSRTVFVWVTLYADGSTCLSASSGSKSDPSIGQTRVRVTVTEGKFEEVVR